MKITLTLQFEVVTNLKFIHCQNEMVDTQKLQSEQLNFKNFQFQSKATMFNSKTIVLFGFSKLEDYDLKKNYNSKKLNSEV